MRRYLFGFLSLVGLVFAKVDYTQMSNEELIALIGYVSEDKKIDFTKELEGRKPTFSEQEKILYKETVLKEEITLEENTILPLDANTSK